MSLRIGSLISAALLSTAFVAGCAHRPQSPEVVVYCALDREFSEPILKRFESETGIRVLPVYDVESTKSVGLAERLRRERARPQCDVFWNNEILNTIRLANDGVIAPFVSRTGQEYPAPYRSSKNLWYGFAGRVRVLLVNTKKVADESTPRRLEDLTDPRWKGQVGIAKPLFGMTATQIACLFSLWGPEKTKDWLGRMKANQVQILSGNKQVAIEVGAGTLAMGLTDTDDALAELRQNRPVRIVYLDAGADDLGILLLPNTISLIAGAPHPESAQRFIDFVLTPDVEESLAKGASGQIPLHPSARVQPDLGLPAGAKRAAVDFEKAASFWEQAMKTVRDEFL